MSIILDALKKAQSDKEKASDQNAPSPQVDTTTDVKTQGPAPTASQAETDSPEESIKKPGSMFNPNNVTSTSTTPNLPDKKRLILLSLVAILALGLVIFYNYGPQMGSGNSELTITALHKLPAKKIREARDQDPAKKEKTADQDKVDALKTEASEYFHQNKYDKSMYVYKQLIDLTPTDSEAYNNYGLALKKLGKLNLAKQSYQTALALDPDYPEALNNLSVIEITDRQFNNAKRHLEKAIEIAPDYLDPYLHLAICLEKTGDIQAAIQYYKSFLDMSEGKINRKIRLQIENRLARLKEDTH